MANMADMTVRDASLFILQDLLLTGPGLDSLSYIHTMGIHRLTSWTIFAHSYSFGFSGNCTAYLVCKMSIVLQHNLARLYWGPPLRKLRLLVGEKQIIATLVLTKADQNFILVLKWVA